MGTGQGVRLFPQRLYEVTVKENQLTPILLIDLNSTDEIARKSPHYRIVGSDYRGIFNIFFFVDGWQIICVKFSIFCRHIQNRA